MFLDHRSVCPVLVLLGSGLIALARRLAHPKESR
jgi:hypothetical protein